MTPHDRFDSTPPGDAQVESHPEPRLEPWMEARVAARMSVDDADIPRDRMWSRIEALVPLEMARRTPASAMNAIADDRVTPITAARTPNRWRTVAAVAALILLGVAIGRFAVPGARDGAAAPAIASVDSQPAQSTTPPSAADMEVRAAMTDHLQQTVLVLATLDRAAASPSVSGDSASRAQLRQLLGTTRLLLDDPSLRDQRTHRLLQDLELVLVQLSRVRAAAPATREVADLTLRETNLLPRLREAASGEGRGSEEP